MTSWRDAAPIPPVGSLWLTSMPRTASIYSISDEDDVHILRKVVRGETFRVEGDSVRHDFILIMSLLDGAVGWVDVGWWVGNRYVTEMPQS